MRTTILLLTLFILFACKDNTKPVQYKSESSKSTSNLNNTSNSTSSQIKEPITWRTVKEKNFTFSLPSNFTLENNLSNFNKKVYTANDETLGLTIDIDNLPNGYENSVITEMIPNLNDFGNSINQDNKRHFDDFKLLNTKKSNIGNKESIEVIQTSTKVSGKNTSMIVQAHFIITNPYYCSITFSYPGNSFQGEQTIEKIKNSFKFESSKTNEQIPTYQTESQKTNQPTLKESQEWLVNKLSDNLVEYYNSTDISYGPITFWYHYYKSVGINNGSLIFEYQEKIESPKGYGKIGQNTTYKNIKVLIPFKKIRNNKFDNYRTSNGKCDFTIYTESNDITEIDLSTGKKNYTSSYEFSFDCSEDGDLGSRFDKAIIHIKNIIPTETKVNNEPF